MTLATALYVGARMVTNVLPDGCPLQRWSKLLARGLYRGLLGASSLAHLVRESPVNPEYTPHGSSSNLMSTPTAPWTAYLAPLLVKTTTGL